MKLSLQILLGAVLVAQLVGCVLVDRGYGHRDYRGHGWHHDNGPVLDVRVGG